MTAWTEDPLPGMPEPPPVKPKPRRAPPKGPRWAKVRLVNAPLCDECMEVSYRAGRWLACARATHKRTASGVDRFLCYRHAQERHERDGLGDLPGVDR